MVLGIISASGFGDVGTAASFFRKKKHSGTLLVMNWPPHSPVLNFTEAGRDRRLDREQTKGSQNPK